MSPGVSLLVVMVAVLVVLAAIQAWMRSQTAALRGQPAPDLAGALGHALPQRALLFFHSPSCGPCRAMAPEIRRLAASDPRVHSVDVTQHAGIARAFRVLATPTVITVCDGSILDSRVGAQGPAVLDSLLSALPKVAQDHGQEHDPRGTVQE